MVEEWGIRCACLVPYLIRCKGKNTKQTGIVFSNVHAQSASPLCQKTHTHTRPWHDRGRTYCRTCSLLRQTNIEAFRNVLSMGLGTAQHNAARHSKTQQSYSRHSSLQCTTPQHSTAQHTVVQHSTAQHDTAQHSTAQENTAWHSTAEHSTAQHSTAQHSTAQHSTAQHENLGMARHSKNTSDFIAKRLTFAALASAPGMLTCELSFAGIQGSWCPC